MLKIKKYNNDINSSLYGLIHHVKTDGYEDPNIPENFTFNHDFSNDGDVIKYQLKSVLDDTLIFDLSINLQDIKDNISFDEQTLWAVDDSFIKENKYKQNVVVPPTAIINVFSKTIVGKTSISEPTSNYALLPIKIFVPKADSSIQDIYILLVEPGLLPELQTPFISTITGTTDIETVQITPTTRSVLVSPINVSPNTDSPVAGDDIVISLTASNVNYVYVQPIVGIVNKTKVKLTNGTGTVTIKTDSLNSGDEVDIKFGYRYFSNIARYTKTLG